MTKYEQKLKKDKASKLKLTDRVEVKKQLKDKLIKEIQGFRTKPSDYLELLKVDKSSIKGIVKEIKRQLDNVHSNHEKKRRRRR